MRARVSRHAHSCVDRQYRIGHDLAKVDLVRVGKPLRPEFAAWRYGARMRRRRWQRVAANTSASLANGAAMAVGATAAFAGIVAGVTGSRALRRQVQQPLESMEAWLNYDRVLAHVRTPDGAFRALRFSHVARLEIVTSHDHGAWTFRLAHQDGITDVAGAEAGQLAGRLMSRLNHGGGSDHQLQLATRLITDAGDADHYIRGTSALRQTRRRKNSIFWDDSVGVLGLTSTERLALEMALHEDTERQAMHGELSALEAAWRDAEEIASIADVMMH